MPSDPPMTVDSPWNSMVLQVSFVGPAEVAGKNIFTPLLKQAGFNTHSTALGVDMKIQSIRIWSLVAGQPIRASFFGFDNTNSAAGGALATIDDYPGRLSYAALGFSFPTSVQNIVYSHDSTAKIFSVELGKSNNWLAYINLLWRGNDYAPFQTSVRYQANASRLCDPFQVLSLG